LVWHVSHNATDSLLYDALQVEGVTDGENEGDDCDDCDEVICVG